MKTVGFILFVAVGFAGSMLFISYMLSPYLNKANPNVIAEDHRNISSGLVSVTPSLTPSPSVVEPTPYVGPDGIPYNRY